MPKKRLTPREVEVSTELLTVRDVLDKLVALEEDEVREHPTDAGRTPRPIR